MTKEIKLTKGKFALVDDDDFEWLKQWKWCSQSLGYAGRTLTAQQNNGKTKNLLMHRVILEHHGLLRDGQIVDHANGNKLDNRKSNLRSCTYSQNFHNRRMSRYNTSGYFCVSFNKQSQKYAVSVGLDNKQLYFGIYDNVHHAGIVANAALTVYHKEFARLNVIPIEHRVSLREIKPPVSHKVKAAFFTLIEQYEAISSIRIVTATPANEAAVSTGEAA